MKRRLIIAISIAFISIAAFAQTYTMSSPSPITTCSGSFYDDGGPLGNYPINQNIAITFKPLNSSDKLSVTFSSFRTGTGDTLFVYNGSSIAATQIGNLSGPSGYGTITSTAADASLITASI